MTGKARRFRPILWGLLILLFVVGAACSSSSQPSDGREETGGPSSGETSTEDAAADGDLEPLQIRFGTGWVLDHHFSWGPVRFKELIEERSDGRITVELIGHEAIPREEQPDAVRRGVLDTAIAVTGYFAEEFPEILVLDYTNMTPAEWRESGGLDFLNELMEARMNFRFVADGSGGREYTLYTVDRVESTADFRGMQIRALPVQRELIERLGAQVVGVDTSEVYTALERGIINGVAYPWFGISPFGWQELLRYKIQPNIYKVGVFFAYNVDAWNRLTDAQRDLIQEVFLQVEEELHPEEIAEVEREEAVLREAGMEIVEISDPDELLRIAQEAGWDFFAEQAPEHAERLQELFSK